MKIRCYQFSEIQSDKIDSLIKDSFFASRGFMDLWSRVGGKPVYWVAESGDLLRCVFPGVEFGRGPLKRFHSMPDGCYGRMFFASGNDADNRAISRRVMREIAQAGYLKAYVYDFYNRLSGNSGFRTEKCETSIVDISGNTWAPPDKKIQSEIRKSEKEGINVTAFDREWHMEKFLALMQSTEERHKRKPKYSRRFFEGLAELAEKDNRLVWQWCEHDGRAVSSHINFIEAPMALNWQVYFDKSLSFLKANQYLLYSFAQKVSQAGVTRLNLGASPPDAEGLIQYKEKWGGRTYAYNCYHRLSRLGRLL